MRAEIYRPDDPNVIVAVATWSGGSSNLQALDHSIDGLDGLLRATPVVVDDPALRGPGTRGELLLEPGSYDWFVEALLTRALALGLRVRFVVDEIVGGWDPAADYGTFEEKVERLASS